MISSGARATFSPETLVTARTGGLVVLKFQSVINAIVCSFGVGVTRVK